MTECREIRIYGPPGTGKTTTLSGLVATACRDYGSESVLVASFTKTAAKELVSRQMPLNDEQVGTLHALCYRALGRPKLVDKALLKDWNAEHPTKEFGGMGTDVDDPYGSLESSGTKDGDLLLQDLNRLRGLRVDEESWPMRIQAFAQDWRDFKANTGTIDFTDLIEECVKQDVTIPHSAAALFLDEVQDFSPLELSLARQWGKSCEVLYLVGDDDQCLYQFKGCTAGAFLEPAIDPANLRVLAQSHRVPRAVHAAAVRWVEQITERMPKDYRPRDYEGCVETVGMTYQYPVSIQGQLEEWLARGKSVAFLASCSFFLDPLKHLLRDWGMPFHNPYRRQRGDWNPLTGRSGTVSASSRVMAYRKLARDAWWTYADLWQWAAILEADPVFRRGAKTLIKRKAEEETTANLPVDPDYLEAWFQDEQAANAAGAGDLDWLQSHMLHAYEKPMRYACRVVERRGEAALEETPKIIVGTIHSVKGGEADIVVLFPDLSPAGYQEWTTPGERQDSVRRCFYVGMTRAKEELHWAQPVGMSIGGYL